MKLIIQILCHNEEMLPITIKDLPRKIEGIDEIEWLVINDGSTDNTLKVAKKLGVNHIINFKKHVGLAKAFMTGIETCLSMGADIIVNTDADNQYSAKDISKLINPILQQKADFVIGTRPIANIQHFSWLKKALSQLGSLVMKRLSKTDADYAPSGFMAFSREAALKLNVFNEYTYTLETIIQASEKQMMVQSVPIEVNGMLRPSRLFRIIPGYIRRSINVIIKTFLNYKPAPIFLKSGIVLLICGISISFFHHDGNLDNLFRNMRLLLLLLGGQMMIMSLMFELFSAQRKLLENIQYKLRKSVIDNLQHTSDKLIENNKITDHEIISSGYQKKIV